MRIGTLDRHYFINNIFNKIKNIRYVILKHTTPSINDINKYSDIDLAIDKNDLNEIIQIIQNIQNIRNINIYKNTFMCTLEIYFLDISFLSLDLIYNFKRKLTKYIDINKLLNSSTLNNENIKIPSIEYSFLYIFLFYFINGKSIENKYLEYFEKLAFNEKQQIITLYNKIFYSSIMNINETYHYNKNFIPNINNYLKEMNSLNSMIKNFIDYFIDLYVNTKKYRYINIKDYSNIERNELENLLKKKYRKELVSINSSELSLFNKFKLKTRFLLKGYIILDFSKKLNSSKNLIQLNNNDRINNFENKVIEKI